MIIYSYMKRREDEDRLSNFRPETFHSGEGMTPREIAQESLRNPDFNRQVYEEQLRQARENLAKIESQIGISPDASSQEITAVVNKQIRKDVLVGVGTALGILGAGIGIGLGLTVLGVSLPPVASLVLVSAGIYYAYKRISRSGR
jgi:hypothetical protein